MSTAKHFLDISETSAAELRKILNVASGIKSNVEAVKKLSPLAGKTLAMIFDKPSTRTRVSFDVGMRQLGGETIILDSYSSQLGQGESIADTARVLSRFVDAIMIRTTSHDRLLELSKYATVPVINGLTDDTHPCQIMADVMTFEEHKGPIAGKVIAWCGDGNNVLNSFVHAAERFNFELRIATPESKMPDPSVIEWARSNGAKLDISSNPQAAVTGSDCVITDTWVSMGQEDDAGGHNTFQPYQVNSALMAKASPEAIFMHCLPAHRGEEVTDEVMDGPQSVVFDEAENRLHAQKGILMWCFGQEYKELAERN